MNENQIKLLIEKYFEGLTSLSEEMILKTFFQQDNIPEELKIYQPIFRFYSKAQQEWDASVPDKVITVDTANRNQIRFRRIQWISIAAAACLVLFVGLHFSSNTQNDVSTTSLAYIDGKKYTSPEIIKAEALKSLENLSEDNDEIISSQIDALNAFFE